MPRTQLRGRKPSRTHEHFDEAQNYQQKGTSKRRRRDLLPVNDSTDDQFGSRQTRSSAPGGEPKIDECVARLPVQVDDAVQRRHGNAANKAGLLMD